MSPSGAVAFGIRYRPRTQHSPVVAGELPAPWRRFCFEAILERRHHRPEVLVSPQGTIRVPDVPGTGFRIKEDLIEHLTVRKETLRA